MVMWVVMWMMMWMMMFGDVVGDVDGDANGDVGGDMDDVADGDVDGNVDGGVDNLFEGFDDKYIHIFFSISASFSLYPHLFEYIHIPHYYIHIFSSISTSVVACLESLSRLKIIISSRSRYIEIFRVLFFKMIRTDMMLMNKAKLRCPRPCCNFKLTLVRL